MKFHISARRVSFALVVAAAASLAACGGGGGSGPGPNPPPTKSPPTQAPPTQAPPTMTPPTMAPSMTPPPATMNPTASPTPAPVATSTPPAFTTPSPAPAGKANVIFEFGVPHDSAHTYANRVRPFYISPGSKSLGVTVDGGSAAFFSLAAGATPGANCTDTATTLYCQVYEAVTTGNGTHNFVATLYSGSSGAGSALSIGSAQAALTGNSVTPLLFEAVVANVKLTLAAPPPPVPAGNYPLHIVLTDASGGTIADDSAYNPKDALYNPVTLSSSDTANGPLSHYGISFQSDVFYVTANYNGAARGPITYSATCSSPASPPAPVTVPACTVQNAVLTP